MLGDALVGGKRVSTVVQVVGGSSLVDVHSELLKKSRAIWRSDGEPHGDERGFCSERDCVTGIDVGNRLLFLEWRG